MIRLKTPLSPSESEVLVRSLSQFESSRNASHVHPRSSISHGNSALLSARQKVQSQIFDCFCHEEMTNMILALDAFSRQCDQQLTETLASDKAAEVGTSLRTAATARAKIRRAMIGK